MVTLLPLSDVCDVSTAKVIKREFSDGIIAPDMNLKHFEMLKGKEERGHMQLLKLTLTMYQSQLSIKKYLVLLLNRDVMNLTLMMISSAM